MYQENNINNFGGSAWVQGATNTPYDNIESIHNDIHDAVGGHNGSSTNPGTMYYLASASFDPIFWMHHAMVDRMLAMWQTLHPNSWIETHNGTKTWTISADMNVNGSTREYPKQTIGPALTKGSSDTLLHGHKWHILDWGRRKIYCFVLLFLPRCRQIRHSRTSIFCDQQPLWPRLSR
jgi:hypothetical protein